MLRTIVDKLVLYSAYKSRTYTLLLFSPGLLQVVLPRHQMISITILEIHLVKIYQFVLQTPKFVL